MVTGQRPFGGTSWHLVNQHLNEEPELLHNLRPGVPPELEELVDDLLAKDPADRPASAQEVATELWSIYDRPEGSMPSQGEDITSEVTLSQVEVTGGALIPLRVTSRSSCATCALSNKTQRAAGALHVGAPDRSSRRVRCASGSQLASEPGSDSG
ncbi:hypothetical protein PUR28_17710 [Streptomyces sp. BE308]|uniref:hypothetical protein n=1 Tax=Streptomyces sp. BE308 TaxID=3002529 RepID=UPI002E77A9DD|nr:hypothetical protein [Streptomyces sp. BE308]MEE1792583.1 hypothetical protein [Streptomyces sp. BE308]